MQLHVVDEVDPPRLLLEHHAQVEQACFALRACCYADEPRGLIDRYRAFERGMREHIAIEEELILPDYALQAPAAAALVRAQHRRLLEQLLRIGIEVELHAIRAESIDRLVTELRAHAKAEDRDMYPWARAHLSRVLQRDLGARVVRSLRALTGRS